MTQTITIYSFCAFSCTYPTASDRNRIHSSRLPVFALWNLQIETHDLVEPGLSRHCDYQLTITGMMIKRNGQVVSPTLAVASPHPNAFEASHQNYCYKVKPLARRSFFVRIEHHTVADMHCQSLRNEQPCHCCGSKIIAPARMPQNWLSQKGDSQRDFNTLAPDVWHTFNQSVPC